MKLRSTASPFIRQVTVTKAGGGLQAATRFFPGIYSLSGGRISEKKILVTMKIATLPIQP